MNQFGVEDEIPWFDNYGKATNRTKLLHVIPKTFLARNPNMRRTSRSMFACPLGT